MFCMQPNLSTALTIPIITHIKQILLTDDYAQRKYNTTSYNVNLLLINVIIFPF